jgi:hypothetical protein
MNRLISFLLLFSFSILLGCQKNEMGGGQDIGGGNVVAAGKVTFEDLQNYVNLLESKREILFRSLEVTSLIAARIRKLDPKVLKALSADEFKKMTFQAHIYDLLFKDKTRSAAILKKAEVELITTGPCYGLNGIPVDGSIYGNEKPICLSAERLLKKLRRDDFEIQVLSLYVHEVSHLFGTNEDEAIQLQKQILEIGPNFKNYLSFLFKPPTQIVESIKKMKASVLTVKSNTSKEVVCPQLQSLFDESYRLFLQDNGQKITISYLRMEDIIRTHAVFVASAFAKDYCESDWSGGKISRLHKWKGQNEVTIAEIYPDPLTLVSFFESSEKTLILSQYLLADLSPIRIKSVKEGDRMALDFNLQMIEDTLDLIVLPPG